MTEPVNPYESPTTPAMANEIASESEVRRHEALAAWVYPISATLHFVVAALTAVVNLVLWLSAARVPLDDLAYVVIAIAIICGLGWAALRRVWLVMLIEAILVGTIAALLALLICLAAMYFATLPSPSDAAALATVSLVFAAIAWFAFFSIPLTVRMRRRERSSNI